MEFEEGFEVLVKTLTFKIYMSYISSSRRAGKQG